MITYRFINLLGCISNLTHSKIFARTQFCGDTRLSADKSVYYTVVEPLRTVTFLVLPFCEQTAGPECYLIKNFSEYGVASHTGEIHLRPSYLFWQPSHLLYTPDGTFTLPGNGNGTGTGNGIGTIGDNACMHLLSFIDKSSLNGNRCTA